MAPEQLEELAVGAWLAQPVFGHDVRRDVERRLNGELKCVLDIALLPQVGLQRLEPRVGAELAKAGLDERQALGDQYAVHHAVLGVR